MNWRYHPYYDGVVSVLEVPIDGTNYTFIPHQELMDMGYESLEDFAIVNCNGRFFELQGYNSVIDAWWVEEIHVTQEEDAGQGMESLGAGGSEGSRGDAQRPSGE